MSVTITAARVCSSALDDGPFAVDIEGGRIEAFRRVEEAPDRILVPGFVDLQVNGHDDVDVATADGAAWERMDALLVAQGVTTWCPTLVSAPAGSYGGALARIVAAAARPTTGRPRIAGAHLEGPFLGGAPGAHPPDLLLAIDLDWLAALPDIVRLVTLAPELDGALDAIRLLTDRGVAVSLGHSTASYEESVAATEAGARLVTHLFNGMDPFHHRRPGLVGAALAHPLLTPCLIADLVHVHPAALRFAMAATEAILVTDAIAWRAPHAGQRVTVTDAPRLPDGTLAGSALTMDAAVRNAVGAGVDLRTAVVAATMQPAYALGLTDRGDIEPGLLADLVVLTPDLEVDEVWIAGARCA